MLTADGRTKVRDLLAQIPRDSYFGNARTVRQGFEQVLDNQASRLVADPVPRESGLNLIVAADIPTLRPAA